VAVWTIRAGGALCSLELVEFEMRQTRREKCNLTFCFLRLHSPHEVVVLSARGGRVTGPCIGSDMALLGTTSLTVSGRHLQWRGAVGLTYKRGFCCWGPRKQRNKLQGFGFGTCWD
jgi:hypothetical protein